MAWSSPASSTTPTSSIPALGLAGGGGFDFRFDFTPIAFGLDGLGADAPTWGAKYKQMLRDVVHAGRVYALAHVSQLPVATELDIARSDGEGRMGAAGDPDDVQGAPERRTADGVVPRHRTWSCSTPPAPRAPGHFPPGRVYPEVHLLGTCRMGDDQRTSVVDRWHRTHDVPNLFLVDGSSFVTGGRGQPTMTIQALAFRAAEHAAAMARRGELGAG